ncbi:MAG: MFS transporter [Nocardioidaceae bacterium]
MAARAVNRLGAFTLPFLAVLLTQRFGASITRAGLVVALFGVGTIRSRLVGGPLADRFGRRTTIVAGLCGCALGQLLVAGSGTLVQAAGATVVLGLAFEIYEAPSQAMIADVVSPADRPAAYGLMAAALALAGMAAGLIALGVGGLDLRLLFVMDAATCLVCAAMVRITLPPASGAGPGSRANHGRSNDVRARVLSPWRDRLLLMLALSGTGFAMIYFQIMVTLPLTLVERGLAADQFGVLLTVSALPVIGGQPVLGLAWLRDQGPTAAMVTGYLLCAVGLLGCGFASSLVGFVAATVVLSLGDLALLGRATALVSTIAPGSSLGRYLAVYGLSWGVAGVVTPVVGTEALSRLGVSWLWTGFASLSLALAVAQLLLRPALVRRLGSPRG